MNKSVVILVTIALGAVALPLPAEPPPIAAYGRLPAISNPTLSPSGQRLAFVSEVDGKRSIVVTDVAGKGLMLADTADDKVRGLQWAGEDYVVARISSAQRAVFGDDLGEYSAIAVLNLQRHTVSWPLAKGRKGNAAFGWYGIRQQAGRWGLNVATYDSSMFREGISHWQAIRSLTRIDLETGELTTVDSGREGYTGWLLDAAGKVIADVRYDDKRKKTTVHAGAHGERLLVELDDPVGCDGIVGQGTTPDTILYWQCDAQGIHHYMKVPLAGGEPVAVLDGVSVREFAYDNTTRLLVGYRPADWNLNPNMFDSRLQERTDAVMRAFPNLQVEFGNWSDDFRQFMIHTEGSGDAGTWWLVNLSTGKILRLGLDYPDVQAGQVAPYRFVKYKAADGTDLDGLLTLPPGRDPRALPLVVMPHGGPAAYDQPSFDWWAQAYASRGYAVWQPNFRGSSSPLDAALESAGYGEWGRKMQTDISDGVAELARQGSVDPARACIVGGSYGGYAALAGVTVQQHLYRCAVAVAGVSDLKSMLAHAASRHGDASMRYWSRYLGVKSDFDDALDAISPARLALQADAPILLIHGKDDTVVPIAQSEKMQRALQAAGKPFEFVRLESEDHWMSRENTRIAMLTAAVDFVLRYNPPEAQAQH